MAINKLMYRKNKGVVVMNNITDKQRIERLEILVMNLSNIVNKMQTGKNFEKNFDVGTKFLLKSTIIKDVNIYPLLIGFNIREKDFYFYEISINSINDLINLVKILPEFKVIIEEKDSKLYILIEPR